MTRLAFAVLGALVLSTPAWAQAPADQRAGIVGYSPGNANRRIAVQKGALPDEQSFARFGERLSDQLPPGKVQSATNR